MTFEFNPEDGTFEFDFDNPDHVKPENNIEEGGGGGPYYDWGFLRLAQTIGVQFQAGAELTIPDIVIDGQPFIRKGLTIGNTKSFWFTLDTTNQNGEPYTKVEMFSAMKSFRVENTSIIKESDKDAKTLERQKKYPPLKVASFEELTQRLPHIWVTDKDRDYFNEKGTLYLSNWGNLQLPALRASLGAKANELRDGAYVEAERTVIAVRPWVTPEGEAKNNFDTYWSSFVVYPTKEAMEEAKKADGPISANPYPARWGDEVDSYLGLAASFKEKHGLLEAAQKILLVDSNKTTVARDNGQPVTLETVAKVFNVTVEEVKAAGISDAPF